MTIGQVMQFCQNPRGGGNFDPIFPSQVKTTVKNQPYGTIKAKIYER